MDSAVRSLLIVAELGAAWGVFAWLLFAPQPLAPVTRWLGRWRSRSKRD